MCGEFGFGYRIIHTSSRLGIYTMQVATNQNIVNRLLDSNA